MSPEPKFVRSTFCSGGNCVEVAQDQGKVLVRDRTGRALPVDNQSWIEFLRAVEAGEFSL
jgi:hypothetical protein